MMNFYFLTCCNKKNPSTMFSVVFSLKKNSLHTLTQHKIYFKNVLLNGDLDGDFVYFKLKDDFEKQ